MIRHMKPVDCLHRYQTHHHGSHERTDDRTEPQLEIDEITRTHGKDSPYRNHPQQTALINMHGVVGEVTVAVSNGINASLIILCIALGVAVPNIFARRYIAKDRQRFLKEELQKRRERGKFLEW